MTLKDSELTDYLLRQDIVNFVPDMHFDSIGQLLSSLKKSSGILKKDSDKILDTLEISGIMPSYSKTVVPYLNSDNFLDKLVFGLWSQWESYQAGSKIDIKKAEKLLLIASIVSPNIQNLENYYLHSLLVSKKCDEFSIFFAKHFSAPLKEQEYLPFLRDSQRKVLMYMGLIEDSFYLVGNSSSNAYHEILSFVQFKHLGYHALAKGMGMHFVSPQILENAKKQGLFKNVRYHEEDSNYRLALITAVDALSTTEWLPDRYHGFEKALDARMKDIIVRRNDPNHPLCVALGEGLNGEGAMRLRKYVTRLHLAQSEIRTFCLQKDIPLHIEYFNVP